MNTETSFPCSRGWQLFGLIALAVLAFTLGAMQLYPDQADSVRSAIRVTARTSFVLFLTAFVASALAVLIPSGFTRGLVRQRRYIGLGFAFSHLVHAIVIYTYGQLNLEFWPGRSWIANTPGTIGYVFIILMALTSFQGPARLIGPAAWKRLHTTGMWVIAAVFCYSYFMRIPMDAVYAIPYGILFAAVVVRLLGKQAQAVKRRQAARDASRVQPAAASGAP
ncbi:ferric reductase-like transmembrane domain-containing protein [Bordetella sp. BOR01]|uniref:ferric reductase-like transmembrane domain-containing protein n=1 Tax=Bordetella sp. BOR01 TaxID=2854779 RepID=UPI001C482258|nr:ferric reductase-like transmembrane domain-containing protein [Bordetella sp. BOR01]MBV7483109.1 hypothetical protein [Bordetella sp. BOR01]